MQVYERKLEFSGLRKGPAFIDRDSHVHVGSIILMIQELPGSPGDSAQGKSEERDVRGAFDRHLFRLDFLPADADPDTGYGRSEVHREHLPHAAIFPERMDEVMIEI